jgi:predicted ribosome quality control (RQC) complex YloA/Tae2 family protein
MAKGFKDDGGNFHPTDNKSKKVSSEQVRSKDQINPQIDNKNLVAKKAELVKKKGQMLPQAYSDEWDKLKRDVENRFDKDFNTISFENLQTVNPNWFEDALTAEPRTKDLKDYFGELNLSDKQFEAKHNEDEIEEAKDELRDQQRDVLWGTIFEAKDSFLADKIKDNSEKIINDLGLVIIDMSNSDKANNYNTGVFIGMSSGGHDFWEAYWVPLYRLFGWV